MASPLIIPFDNNPVSASVKTTSYTIPSGKFARVYVAAHSGGTMSINGVIAVDTDPFLNVDVSTATNAVFTYTVPVGYAFYPATFGQTSGFAHTGYLNGNTAASFPVPVTSASAQVTGMAIGPSGTISMNYNATSTTRQLAGLAVPSNKTHAEVEFFLPAGTVITGAGSWRAVVQEYNAIS
jgi:hypothetical protein